MISIREVAKLAGVSPSTVSRVMNGTANVDKEKKERVLRVIEETGFSPNQVARSLFKKSSKMIGVILPNITNPFFTEITRYIEDEAYRLDYKIIICYSDNNYKKEKENLRMLISMNTDGIILLANDGHIKEGLGSYHIPIVELDRNLNSDKSLAHISANHYQGAVLATEHLINCGCKNMVNMKGPINFSSARYRLEGYMDTCKKYNIEIQTVDCDYDYKTGIKSTEELLNKYPNVEGIIASNDIVAISAYKVLKSMNKSVPEDIMIVGFDDIEMSKIFTPEITTIHQPIEEIGRKAVRNIANYKKGEIVQDNYILDVDLIERETTIRR
ncbi:LacI family DNA-binding transcriptional regulator [Miniphocaeibacter massiliensis]|uniref:LacI family DNA-binding transcriptional regulator n=1 Tax=Miniphocaeibacter massiliensis TaxID=2041841 RepID=UPI000C1C0B2C|nr:LacI family DNA-binding transcriptional regulator [Miniphocaeibacter massiliensis]